jgi:hypothetical protein
MDFEDYDDDDNDECFMTLYLTSEQAKIISDLVHDCYVATIKENEGKDYFDYQIDSLRQILDIIANSETFTF